MKRFNPCGNHAEPEPVVDPPPPETPQIVNRQQPYAGQEKRRETLFTRHYGQLGAPKVSVPYGMMAVHLSVKFDNSDIQTDYFDRHASLSPDFALLVVKKQAETERLARKALALVPEFNGSEAVSAVTWKWHSEKYSMGHGNYLESSGLELPEELKNLQTGYRSGGVTHGHWEIEFSQPYREGQVLELLPHKNYGQHLAVRPPVSSGIGTMALTENREKNGLELRFPTIPSEPIRSELKGAGWRWSRFGGCWYVRDTEASRRFAANFITRFADSKPERSPAQPVIPRKEPPILPAPVIHLETAADVIPTWRQRFKCP